MVVKIINDTIVYIPNGTTYIEVEYNLTWTPSIYGAKDGSLGINGYSSHVIERELGTQSYKYLVDDDGVSVPENDPNKNGTLIIPSKRIKSLVISKHAVNGTFKIYAVKRNVEYKWRI